MPISGQGVVPASGNIYNELVSTVRRAFVPKLIVQLYYASPVLYYLMGNTQKAAGGLSQITIPVQGNSMVQGQYTGYGGGFNSPTITPGVLNAQFPLSFWVVPIPIVFGEQVLQATDTVISLLKARMNDAYAVTYQNVAQNLFTNNTANSLMPNSFYDAFDDGTNVATYGGLSRTGSNSWWQGQYYVASSSSGQPGNAGFKRSTMASQLAQITDAAGGEAPSCVIMNYADWATLQQDFIGTETAFVTPSKDYGGMNASMYSGFPNLNVNGIPIFADHFVPQGTAYFPNFKYTSMYISEDWFFDFSGFFSLVPLGQIGQQGVLVLGYNMITAKPVANAVVTGIASPAWS